MGVEIQEVPGYSKYRIYSDGRVYSQHYKRFISCNGDKDGYVRVTLVSDQGLPKTFLMHRLVAKHFVENKNPSINIVVNHLDGNIKNNCHTNLEWTTVSGNVLHSFRRLNRKMPGGEENPGSKYTWEQVRCARHLYSKGASRKIISQVSGIRRDCLYPIVSGRTWKE